MIRHYLRTAARTVTRHPGFSAINILGLSVGVAVAVMLFLFVHSEWTYDRFHEDSDRIYRTWLKEDWGPGQQFFNTVTPIRLGPTVLDQIPDVEAWVRYDRVTSTVTMNETSLNETIFMVDANFLDVFDFEVLDGDSGTMLAAPGRIVLTESARERWFGDEQALGRTLTLEMDGSPMEVEVAGILEDVPTRSSLQFEMLISYEVAPAIYPEGRFTAWFNVSPETYVVLRPGADPRAVQEKIEPVVKSQMTGDDLQVSYTVGFQPMTDIHLDPDYPIGYAPVNNPVYARVLFVIAWLILGTACINFVTLSISRSVERSREIGVRKAIGASRGELLRQYWGESLLYSAISLLVGVVGAELLLPGFNALTGQPVSLAPTPAVIGLFAGIFVALGLLAGLYPALVLSGFSPVDAIRGRSRTGRGASTTRKTLVVAQFALSIILLAATFVVTGQVRSMKNADLGFDGEQVAYVFTELNSGDTFALAERLRFEIADDSELGPVGSSLMLFDDDGWGRIGYTDTDGDYRRFWMNIVDHSFVETFGLEMIRGRDFDPDRPGDLERAFVVNESFVREYGWENPLTEQLPGDWVEHEIIGVVQDFHFTSLHTPVQPAVLAVNSGMAFSGIADFDYDGELGGKVAVRLNTTNLPAAVDRLEAAWSRAAPEVPFDLRFVNQDLDRQYRQEERLASIVSIGSGLAVLIAALGLLGLAALAVARRTREIGVRKVLGASAMQIVALFGREFSGLVAVAFIVAVPVAWFAADAWLATFAFRMDLGPGPFLLAGGIALVVTWLTVGFQAMQAAVSNPVDSLRTE